MKNQIVVLSDNDMINAQNFLNQIKRLEKIEQLQLLKAEKLAQTVYTPTNKLHYMLK